MSSKLSAHLKRQFSKFDQLWNETSDAWPPPGFTVEQQTKKSWGLIALPEEKAWINVCDMIDVIAETWPWNVTYALPQLHVTLMGLGNASFWNRHEETLHAIFRQIAVQQQPVAIDFHGLCILRNTIVVQVIDKNNAIKVLVDNVTDLLTEAGLSKHLKIGIHNELWWTSIVRLYQPIPDEIFTFVESFKNVRLGSALLQSVHLIENNKTHDPLAVSIIDSYTFSGSS